MNIQRVDYIEVRGYESLWLQTFVKYFVKKNRVIQAVLKISQLSKWYEVLQYKIGYYDAK